MEEEDAVSQEAGLAARGVLEREERLGRVDRIEKEPLPRGARDDGELLGPGRSGEVVIRGPNVTPGYEANPEANAAAFVRGWFRTGDLGLIQEDGYLKLTGRIKEQINRGGEKFSPHEVDEVLLEHPAVQQVVTFPVPHPKLGEDVAAAVVLHEGSSATDHELRAFAQARLLHFKVPRKILIVAEIPKGATAKLQRMGLAAKLGVTH